MSSNRKILLYLSGALVLVMIVFFVAKATGVVGSGTTIEVTTGQVKKRTIVETVSASGKIYPETEVTISPDVSGEVTELFFEEGDSVMQGDLILRIRPDVYESIVSRAEATLNQAKANLSNALAREKQVTAQFKNTEQNYLRNKELFESKVVSLADFQAIEASYNVALGEQEAALESVNAAQYSVKSTEAGLKEARDNLTRTEIYAPMSGILSMLAVEKGERVVGTSQMPGTDMMRIANLNNIEVHVDVSENDINRVTEGDTAIVEIDAYFGKKFKGIVSHIATSSTLVNALQTESVTNFKVKISLLRSSYEQLANEAPIKPGMSASVEIETEKVIDGLSVPIQAVAFKDQAAEEEEKTDEPQVDDEEGFTEIVYLNEGGAAKLVEVETGIQDDRFIYIKSGLEDDQEIITGPFRAVSRLLEDGDAITIIDPNDLAIKAEKEQ